jgi:recombinational DNA repair protein (RecF pathway)
MIHVAPEHEPVPELFKLHSNALAFLEGTSEPKHMGVGPLLNAYLSKLLQWSGNQPQIQSCLSCEKSLESLSVGDTVKLVIREAGWICVDCGSGVTSTKHIEGGEQGGRLSERGSRLPVAVFFELNRYLREPLKDAVPSFRPEVQALLFGILKNLLEYHVPGFKLEDFKTFRFVESTEPLPAGYRPHSSSSP